MLEFVIVIIFCRFLLFLVQRARNLLVKGRSGTNDAFVLIQMGKEKFQTSVKEKCSNPEWYEECDLPFLGSNVSVVHLVVFHRNLLGLDEFLGQVFIPLKQFESYDRHICKWFPLQSKTDKKSDKERGELEVKISFVVRSADTQSLNEFGIEKKKRKGLKGLATTVGHKIQKLPGRTLSLRQQDFNPRNHFSKFMDKRHSIASFEKQPVNSEGDFNSNAYDDSKTLPLKSIKKLGPIYPPQSPRQDGTLVNFDTKQEKHGEWTKRISSRMKDLTRSEMNLADIHEETHPQGKKSAIQSIRNTLRRHTLQLSEPPDLSSLKLALKKNTLDKENKRTNMIKEFPAVLPEDIPQEIFEEYSKKNHHDLVILAIKQQAEMEQQRDKIADLENYLDHLLVRVMETTPKILQIPYKPNNLAYFR